MDVVSGADVLEFYAGLVGSGGLDSEGVRLGSGGDGDGDGKEVRMTREPLGVCVGIGAWNYPLQM